jgi:hypothetical protein
MPSEHKGTRKQKAVDELKDFWVIFLYLVVLFSAFLTYRRLVLKEVGVSYLHYGMAVAEAAIIGHTVSVGEKFRLGKRTESHRLIVTVVLKTVIYALFVGLFTFLEHIVEGFVRKDTWGTIVHNMASVGRVEFLARTLIVFASFLPFFALYEACRVLSDGGLYELFFEKRSATKGE